MFKWFFDWLDRRDTLRELRLYKAALQARADYIAAYKARWGEEPSGGLIPCWQWSKWTITACKMQTQDLLEEIEKMKRLGVTK